MVVLCPWSSNLRVRLVPEAEVSPGILNVGFGDVVYQGVKVLGATYIGRGGWRTESPHYGIPHIYFFLIPHWGWHHNRSAKDELQL